MSLLDLRRRMTCALLIVLAGLAIVPATGAARATGPGTYTVIPKVVYPGEKPGGPFVGSLRRGQIFVVTRLSASGKWAYGNGVGKLSGMHGWVRSVALRPRSASTANRPCRGERVTVTSPLYVKVRPEGPSAGGYLMKGDTFLVFRTSASGKYTYGYAFGGINGKGWVNTADLHATGCTPRPNFTG